MTRPLPLLLLAAWLLPAAASVPASDSRLENGRPVEAEALRALREARFQTAESEIRRLLETRPSAPRLRYLLGFALLAQHRHAEAETELARAVASAPSRHEWREALAKSLFEQGRHGAAASELGRAIALSPESRYRYQKALAHEAVGDFQAAEVELRACLTTRPQDAAALSMLGGLLADRRETGEARQLLQRALELEPDRVEARHRLGLLELAAGRPEEAEEAFGRVLERAPSHVGATYNLARLLHLRGASEEARAMAERFREANLLQERIESLEDRLRVAPRALNLRLELAKTRLRSGRPDLAGQDLRAALALEPGHAEAQALLAVADARAEAARRAPR